MELIIHKKQINLLSIICIISLIITSLPLSAHTVKDTSEWTGTLRIEGEFDTIFYNTITVGKTILIARNVETGKDEEFTLEEPTILSAIITASSITDFNYEIEYWPSWNSLYVKSIGESSDGWKYWMNYQEIFTGPDQAILTNEHTHVLWGYSIDWYSIPLKIHVDKTQITKHENITITVTNNNDEPIPKAIVYVGGQTHETDENGIVSISQFFPGRYMVYAEHQHDIRSEKTPVLVKRSKVKTFDGLIDLFRQSYISSILETLRYQLFGLKSLNLYE